MSAPIAHVPTPGSPPATATAEPAPRSSFTSRRNGPLTAGAHMGLT
jgi:predicted lipid-binding transport protein (Tim44 family)